MNDEGWSGLQIVTVAYFQDRVKRGREESVLLVGDNAKKRMNFL